MIPWKRFRHSLEEFLCRALAWGIPLLSRRACVRVGEALGTVAFHVDRRGRKVALANLACVFADRLPAWRLETVRSSYRNFARTMMDLFWAPRITAGNFREYIHLEGYEPFRERIERERRGIVFMCVHQGNWEWASLLGGFTGHTSTVVAENFKNPRLTAIFTGLRQSSGQTIIPQENSILRLLKIAKRGGATGMLIDLSLHPSQAGTVIEGFGFKMCVPVLHAVLAQRVGALLVPIETQPLSDGTCRIVVHPPVEFGEEATPHEIAQRCWDVFEPIVRARPELWLWPYKHFRYKPKGAERNYPFYAHTAGRFEKLFRSISPASESKPAPAP